MPYLAWSLISHKILGGTKSGLRIFLTPRIYSVIYFRVFSQRVYHLCFFVSKYFQLYYLFSFCVAHLLLSSVVHAQDYSEFDEDPYLDPTAANNVLQPITRTKSTHAYMFGFNYGLNPIILLAPAVSIGLYFDPVVLGLEVSDSETLGIWEKERLENLGRSSLSGDTQFIKWFYSSNFYLIAAKENRSIKLYSRTYNRSSGKALFDMFVETAVSSLGAGYLRFGEVGFFSIDIVRYNLVKNHTVKVVEYYETYSELSGNRDTLDENIKNRSEKWVNTINAHTGFVITFGIYF